MTSIQSTYREREKDLDENFAASYGTNFPVMHERVKAHNKATTIALLRAVIGEIEALTDEYDAGYDEKTSQPVLLNRLITKLNETISGIEDGV